MAITKEVFSERRETVILIPRGCGKSSLLGAIGLWDLLTAPTPARSSERPAVSRPGFCSTSCATSPPTRPSPSGWRSPGARSAPRTASSTPPSAPGCSSATTRGLVTISTAGSHADTPLGALCARALRQPKVEHEGTFTRAIGPNQVLERRRREAPKPPPDPKPPPLDRPTRAFWMTTASRLTSLVVHDPEEIALNPERTAVAGRPPPSEETFGPTGIQERSARARSCRRSTGRPHNHLGS